MNMVWQEAAWTLVSEEQASSDHQPFWMMFMNASIHSLHRPAAVFLPIISWTLSFHAAAMFLDVRIQPQISEQRSMRDPTCVHPCNRSHPDWCQPFHEVLDVCDSVQMF